MMHSSRVLMATALRRVVFLAGVLAGEEGAKAAASLLSEARALKIKKTRDKNMGLRFDRIF